MQRTNRIRTVLAGLVLVAGCMFSTEAFGAVIGGPITNPANGHEYYLLSNMAWTTSESEAISLGGHLATINDAAENTWIFDTFFGFGGTGHTLWIGFNDVASEGTWVWSSGEPVTYTGWAPASPDNYGGNQDYGYIHNNRLWDDAPNFWNAGPPVHGVVEVAPIPEPATLALLALGSVGLVRRRRR